MSTPPEDNNLWGDHLEVPDAALPVDPDPEPQLLIEDEGNLNQSNIIDNADDNEEVEVRELVVNIGYDGENRHYVAIEFVLEHGEEVDLVVVELGLNRRDLEAILAERNEEEEVDANADNVRASFGESPDTSSEEEDHDEDDGHLSPHLQFTQRIPPDFSLPSDHEEPEESLERPEDRVSRKRRREEDAEDEEDHDEDDGHLPPHLQFTQRIPPDFSLPSNHEEPEESLERPEDRVSRKRRREEDAEEERPGKRPRLERDV
ncbi:histone acetyltransferase KAT6A-like isoform X2 [Cyprinodon tularosa]|uniref:histone acetyltransferase KAT6A-like isoform X2 n=1 Tax=Cyprinodon tularosa TaxID=77115 RepID=UPI0018E268BE|nr:histone acetyltransferase KAT6A-like isoform X2 [Cyprinodon tularosa]